VAGPEGRRLRKGGCSESRPPPRRPACAEGQAHPVRATERAGTTRFALYTLCGSVRGEESLCFCLVPARLRSRGRKKEYIPPLSLQYVAVSKAKGKNCY
jgi:hypothetical protein